jgi:hypothetical protein
MTYKPARRMAFGPTIKSQWPSLAFLAFALAVTGVILYGQMAPSGTRLFAYVVEGDSHRLVSSTVCAIVLCTSAVAAVVREQMRGVIVYPDGIELRELLSFGVPRVRRYHWSQIDKMFVPPANPTAEQRARAIANNVIGSIRLDLWDGSRAWLPEVARANELGIVLERVALARAIPIEGGTGMMDDLGNPLGDDGAGGDDDIG